MLARTRPGPRAVKITRTMLKAEARKAFGPAFDMISDLSSPRFFYQVGVHIEWKGQPLAVYRVATTKTEAFPTMYEHLKHDSTPQGSMARNDSRPQGKKKFPVEASKPRYEVVRRLEHNGLAIGRQDSDKLLKSSSRAKWTRAMLVPDTVTIEAAKPFKECTC